MVHWIFGRPPVIWVQSWTVSDTCVRCQPAPSLRWVHFRWGERPQSFWGRSAGLAGGVGHVGSVPYRTSAFPPPPCSIDRHGVAYFHQYLPIEPTAASKIADRSCRCLVRRMGFRGGLGRLPVVVLLEAYGAGTVVEKRRVLRGNPAAGFRRGPVLGAARPRVDQRSHVIVFGGRGRTEQLGSCRFWRCPINYPRLTGLSDFDL